MTELASVYVDNPESDIQPDSFVNVSYSEWWIILHKLLIRREEGFATTMTSVKLRRGKNLILTMSFANGFSLDFLNPTQIEIVRTPRPFLESYFSGSVEEKFIVPHDIDRMTLLSQASDVMYKPLFNYYHNGKEHRFHFPTTWNSKLSRDFLRVLDAESIGLSCDVYTCT